MPKKNHNDEEMCCPKCGGTVFLTQRRDGSWEGSCKTCGSAYQRDDDDKED
jgi:ribosomal protein S27AE